MENNPNNKSKKLSFRNFEFNFRFTWEDSDHRYFFGVCTKADQAKFDNEAFIQINKKSNRSVVIGRLEDVDLEGFNTECKLHWVLVSELA